MDVKRLLMNRRYIVMALVLFLVGGYLWVLSTRNGQESSGTYKINSGFKFGPSKVHWLPVSPQSKKDMPVIVTWDAIGGHPDRDIMCRNHRCHVTSDRTLIPHEDVLGILFYGTTFATNGLPLPRKPGHLWSLMHDKSPANNDWLFCARNALTFFNLTSTFKRESHYPLSTMWLNDERDLTSADFVVPLPKKNQLRTQGLAPVVFVHKHCDTPSDRTHYMQLLQQYIRIDSYGRCGHNKNFPNKDLKFTSDISPMTSIEFYKLLAQYKFTFAFENTVCDDYVTEKFWRPLHLGVVPLAFGSSKIKDMGPSNYSVINIGDFRTAKELADYISFLDSNDDEYSKYLTYKQNGITNEALRTLLEQRNWDDGRVWNVQYDGFQCYICEKLYELRDDPTKQWSGKPEYFNCPMPKVFDSEGRYVVENNTWADSYWYGKYYLDSILYYINGSKNVSREEIHRFAKELQRRND